MGLSGLVVCLLLFASANAQQLFRVCAPLTEYTRCQIVERDGSQVTCNLVPTRAECAIRLSQGLAEVGYFSEEELLLLSQVQPNSHRVIATVRDVNRMDDYSFEGVVVVPSTHTNGFEGLRGGRYLHPGFGPSDQRWSPRVLRSLENLVTSSSRCSDQTNGKTAEELEVETLSSFFSEACRPGPWSSNSTVDADLKSRFPNLCSLCTAPGNCTGYATETLVSIAGVPNSNTHIQALDRLVQNGSVAFAAWTHVRQFFQTRNPQDASSYSILCEDGTLIPVAGVLDSTTAPCAIVRQPWGAIVAVESMADTVSTNLQSWFPASADPGGNSWQSNLFAVLTPGGPLARLSFELNLVTPLNYTSRIRSIANIDATSGCLPARRWCTTSSSEQNKCTWLRQASHTLGLAPSFSCEQRSSVFECLSAIRDSRADFISVDSHYGYLARQHFSLSPVKLVQNTRGAASRVAVLVKEAATGNVSRFENLRDKVACFPEFGSIAYVAFLRAAQINGVISESECDYARAVGEFVRGACAPGAADSGHTISAASSYDASNLCSACRPAVSYYNDNNLTCSWNYSNLYYGNNGSLLCLSDPATDFAVVELQNITTQFAALNLQPSDYRALCVNNSLAATSGGNIDDGCLIANVVDAEVLMRRNDPTANSVNTLLDSLEEFFGYNTAASQQLINLHIYSPFDGTSDLLFKDSTIGLTEPSIETTNPQARNYIEMFRHLEECTSRAPEVPGAAYKFVYSLVTLFVMTVLTQYVIY